MGGGYGGVITVTFFDKMSYDGARVKTKSGTVKNFCVPSVNLSPSVVSTWQRSGTVMNPCPSLSNTLPFDDYITSCPKGHLTIKKWSKDSVNIFVLMAYNNIFW